MEQIVLEGGPHDGAEFETNNLKGELILMFLPKPLHGLGGTVWECKYRRTERIANDSRRRVYVYAGAEQIDPSNFPSYGEYRRTEDSGSGPST